MSSLGGVGFGLNQQGMPDLGKGQIAPAVRKEEQPPVAFEDNSRIGGTMGQSSRSASVPVAPLEPQEIPAENIDKGVYIGICNSLPVNMRVGNNGEAEYNCGNSGWSKSPPLSFSKSKIRTALDTLKTMGIDVKGYEKSLGSFDNNSAPISLLAEDDIHNSYSVLQSLHTEQAQAGQPRKNRISQVSSPLIITNPDYYDTQYNISPSKA
jgi:hypothetical protein